MRVTSFFAGAAPAELFASSKTESGANDTLNTSDPLGYTLNAKPSSNWVEFMTLKLEGVLRAKVATPPVTDTTKSSESTARACPLAPKISSLVTTRIFFSSDPNPAETI